MKILVIPDVHLKPWMFDKAEELMNKYHLDGVVFIGDLVDDWNQDCNIFLYKETIERAIQFKKDHPDSKFCYGNHEVGYMFGGTCNGNSALYYNEILPMINRYERLVEPQLAFKIDNVVFSHAGLTVDYNYDSVDQLPLHEAFKKDNSPLWVRPNLSTEYNDEYIQVAGHTPVKHITKLDNVYLVDSFGSDSEGNQCGDQTFMSIDTVTCEVTIYKDGEII